MASLADIQRLYRDGAGAGSTLPPFDWFPITPHATDPLANVARAIRANTAGTVICRLVGSSSDRTLNFLAGETRYGYFTHIRDTSTATGLEGAL